MAGGRTIQGKPISPGRVVGDLCILSAGATAESAAETSSSAWEASRYRRAEAGAPEEEASRFRRAARALIQQSMLAADRLEAASMSAEADIMRAHAAMLEDSGFQTLVVDHIRQARWAAERAVAHVLESMAEVMARASDLRMAERATDFRDLARQLDARLTGSEPEVARCVDRAHSPILATDELVASTVLEAHAVGVRGFVVTSGTGFSHGAILARSFGLPAIVLRSLAPLRSAGRTQVLLDGDAGKLIIAPTPVELTATAPPRPDEPAPAQPLPARLWLSIVDPDQLIGIDWTGVEGVGLYRTEVIYLQNRHAFPGEDQQLRVYRRVFAEAGDRAVVVRTADLGADKAVSHMALGPQRNPYMGLRAHRLFRFHPEILVTQVRAVLRAAAGAHRLRLMFPMLETMDQWRFVQLQVMRAIEGLRAEGLEYQERFEQGVLIETPSAVWSFDEFAEAIDFASIGTNDLVQYFFAVERDAANVTDLYQPEHPVMLRVLQSLADRASRAGKPMAICGEIAADEHLAPVLVGLGIENLSISPSRLTAVREVLARLTRDDCRHLAEQCLAAAGADESRRRMGMPPRRSPALPGDPLLAGQAKDPICGMVVDLGDEPLRAVRRGRTYFFCSAGCLREFRDQTEGAARDRVP